MSEFRMDGDFEISADALWGAVRDFGNVSWLPGDPTSSRRATEWV